MSFANYRVSGSPAEITIRATLTHTASKKDVVCLPQTHGTNMRYT